MITRGCVSNATWRRRDRARRLRWRYDWIRGRAGTRRGWALRVAYDPRDGLDAMAHQEAFDHIVEARGEHALAAASKLLPAINAAGADRRVVREAVELLEETPDVDELFSRFASAEGMNWWVAMRRGKIGLGTYPAALVVRSKRMERALRHYGPLRSLDPAIRFALEMASHEDIERRAALGDLAVIRQFWMEAREIAGTSDGMFPQVAAEERLRELKSHNVVDLARRRESE